MNTGKWKRADFLLLCGMIAVGSLFGLFLLLAENRGTEVRVYVDGEVVNTFSLDEDLQYEICGAHGGVNLLRIEDGKAYIEAASCPDGLCMHMGKIDKNGQSIVCLPNKVTVEIAGGGEAYDVDLAAR